MCDSCWLLGTAVSFGGYIDYWGHVFLNWDVCWLLVKQEGYCRHIGYWGLRQKHIPFNLKHFSVGVSQDYNWKLFVRRIVSSGIMVCIMFGCSRGIMWWDFVCSSVEVYQWELKLIHFFDKKWITYIWLQQYSMCSLNFFQDIQCQPLMASCCYTWRQNLVHYQHESDLLPNLKTVFVLLNIASLILHDPCVT